MERQLYNIIDSLSFYCKVKNLDFYLKVMEEDGEVKLEVSSKSNEDQLKSLENTKKALPAIPTYVDTFNFKPKSKKSVYSDPSDQVKFDTAVSVFKVSKDQYATTMINLLDGEEVDNFFYDAFEEMQQVLCKEIAKQWIKIIEPKKQTNYPYKQGNKSKPKWWPKNVIHKEPDHLSKNDRLKLLTAILSRFGTIEDGLLPAALKTIESTYESYKTSDSQTKVSTIDRRIKVVEEMFKVRAYLDNPANLLNSHNMSVLKVGKRFTTVTKDDDDSTETVSERSPTSPNQVNSIIRHKDDISSEDDSSPTKIKQLSYTTALTPRSSHYTNSLDYPQMMHCSTPFTKPSDILSSSVLNKENTSPNNLQLQTIPHLVPALSSPKTPTRGGDTNNEKYKSITWSSPFYLLDLHRNSTSEETPEHIHPDLASQENIFSGRLEEVSLKAEPDVSSPDKKKSKPSQLEFLNDDNDNDSDSTIPYTGSP